MRALALGILTGVSFCVAAPAAVAEAVTTRIETRPFYGATVTLEEGVRVFRPLPRHDRVIINPGGQTPLSLGYYKLRNYSFNQFAGDGHSAGSYGPTYYGGFGNVLPRGRHHGHHGHHRLRPALTDPLGCLGPAGAIRRLFMRAYLTCPPASDRLAGGRCLAQCARPLAQIDRNAPLPPHARI